ncbi:MAG: FHA domain-containing protein [Candidatus Limnocylindria bacterium]
MGLTGTLGEFPLVPLIRLFEASRSTGTLHVRRGAVRATLGFAEGSLVAASYGSEHGEMALSAATALTAGSFRWAPGSAPEAELSGTADELLARATAVSEKVAAARELIPDDRVRFVLAGGDTADKTLAVKPQHWRILSVVDGRRDVDGMARAAGEGKLATLWTLAELLQQGLIRMIEAPPPKPARKRVHRAPSEVTAEAAEPALFPKPAQAADPGDAPTIVAERLTAEVDARLAAIAALTGESVAALSPDPSAGQTPTDAIASDAPPSKVPASGAKVEENDDLTQVIVAHYLPPTMDRPAVQAPRTEAPARGGLFGLFRGRSVRTAQDEVTLPSAEQLAQLANALLTRAAQTPGSQPSQSAVQHLQQLYQARPIGHRVPTREVGGGDPLLGARVPDLVDEETIAQDPAGDRFLPVLAALVERIRDVEGRAMGTSKAIALYREAVAEVFGEARHKSATTMMIRSVATATARARVTVRIGGPRGPYELSGRECTIGRSASSYIVLQDSSVSGQHARLIPRPDGYTLVDLGSRNGTTVNGERLDGQRVLRGGEAIGIGEAILDFEIIPT